MLALGKYGNKIVTTNDAARVNSHIVLIGESGTGKTVQAQKFMVQVVEQGGTVIAIDWHGTLADDQIFPAYRESFNKFKNDIEAHECGIPVPLFTPLTYQDGTKENPIDLVGSIVEIFKSTFRLGDQQEAELRKAAEFVQQSGSYAKEGIKALGDALRMAGNARSEAVLNKLHYLIAHNVFVDGTEFYQPGRINIFRLGRFDLGTQTVIAESIVNYIWRLGNVGAFKDKPIYLFIDEVQNMPSGENGGMAHLLSEGRKFGINLIVATQFVVPHSTKALQQRLTQGGLMLYFKPTASRIGQTAKFIDASRESDWCRILRSLRVGEFVAVGSFLVDGIEMDEPLKISARETK